MEYNYKRIGEIIVRERDKRGWTQSDLIDELSPYVPIARNRLSELENGKAKRCDFILLTTLCRLFECEMSYLLGERELPTKVDELICQETGLDAEAVKLLHTAKKDNHWFVCQAANKLLKFNNLRLLDLLGQYLMMDESETVELNDGERIDKGVLYSRKIEQELVKLRFQIQRENRCAKSTNNEKDNPDAYIWTRGNK